MTIRGRLARVEAQANRAFASKPLVTFEVSGRLIVDGRPTDPAELVRLITSTRPSVVVNLGPCDWPPAQALYDQSSTTNQKENRQ